MGHEVGRGGAVTGWGGMLGKNHVDPIAVGLTGAPGRRFD